MIDLHVHSTASDGEVPPGELMRRAAAAGLTVVGLADHDTLAGVPEAVAAAGIIGVRVIAACEFSVAASWGEMHLLGYFLPSEEPGLARFLVDQRQKRVERARRIVERLTRLGVRVTFEQVLHEADGAVVGRPHVARTLVRGGGASSVQAAFSRYLGSGRPAFVPKELPPVAEVTKLIREMGGVSSAAHLADHANRSTLEELAGQGVDAIEARHPSHDESLARRIEAWAGTLGLRLSGGSDWHGGTPGEPDRAPLGSISIPREWLDELERLHESRVASSEVAS